MFVVRFSVSGWLNDMPPAVIIMAAAAANKINITSAIMIAFSAFIFIPP
jgi:hypothetical protein